MSDPEKQSRTGVEHRESEPSVEELQRRIADLEAMNTDLVFENAELRELAMRDSKTGLWNDRGLRELAGFLIKEHSRDSKPLCVLVLDIDNFKELNSRFGNPEVDRLMNDLGQELITMTRGSDVVARHGGDEFVIIFTADQADIIRKFLDSQTQVSQVKLKDRTVKGESVSITFSGGIANVDLTKRDQAFDDALEKAFQAQILAKQNKGRIEKFQE